MQSVNNATLLQHALDRLQRASIDDSQLRAVMPISQNTQALRQCSTCIELLAQTCALHAARPCIASRQPDKLYGTLSYADLWRRAQQLAAGVAAHQLLKPGEFAGLLGFGSADWVVADLACLYRGAVSVPLQTSFAETDLRHILDETQMRVLFCSRPHVSRLAPILARCSSLRALIILDSDPADHGQQAALADHTAPLVPQIEVQTMAQLEQTASPFCAPIVPGQGSQPADALTTLMYTSGSTGSPKGAIFTDALWLEELRIALEPIFPNIPTVSLNYLPLNHIMGRSCHVLHTLLRGGTVHFTQSHTMDSLLDDIRLARPTVLGLVPRVAGFIYDHYKAHAEARQGIGRTMLGDRLTYIYTGSAPTSPEVVQFLQDCFDVPVFNYYGSTECGPVTFDHRVINGLIETYQLVDVPLLGYSRHDKPFPRGELRVKSRRMIAGYYNNAAASALLRDADGFMPSGDIVEERLPQMLYYIDRKNSVIKLSQGEFVAVTRLEGLFVARSPDIAQIYLYGESTRAFLLAVVVPSEAALQDSGGALKARLRAALNAVATSAEMQGYETPRDFLVETQAFSQVNGLLTESNKPARARLKEVYGPRLVALYEQLETSDVDAMLAIKSLDIPLEDKVRRLLAHALGLPQIDAETESSTFSQLGGDSLTAVRLSTNLAENYGLHLPVNIILSPSSTLAGLLARAVQNTPAARHALATGWLHAADIDLGAFLPAALLHNRPLPSPPSSILLTGANGFLGRFLALELLERLPAGSEVVCLVRGRSQQHAEARLHAAWQDCTAFQQRLAAAPSTLRVIAGDLGHERFGLSQEDYRVLCWRVDTILHNGALVNHALSYEQLYDPNVLGTVEALRCALTGQPKALCFVSTAGLFGGRAAAKTVSEDMSAAALWSARQVDRGYAAGYNTSKWVGELLAQQLHQRCNVPVRIVRPGMVLPHSQYIGQFNAPDVYARFLYSLVHTAVAPPSFYQPQALTHFDATPVDCVASGIAAIARTQRQGFGIYHAVNPHWQQGIGFDHVARWVLSAGCRIQVTDSHSAWFARFKDSLEGLPIAARAHSLWPLLTQWESPLSGDPPASAELFAEQLRRHTQWDSLPLLAESSIHQSLRHLVQARLIAPEFFAPGSPV